MDRQRNVSFGQDSGSGNNGTRLQNAKRNNLDLKDAFGSKEGSEEISPGYQYATRQQASKISNMQIRRTSNNFGLVAKRLVDGIIRPKGRLLSRVDPPRFKKMVRFPLEGHLVPLQSAAFRSDLVSLGVYKDCASSDKILEKQRLPRSGILGRLSYNGRIKGSVGTSDEANFGGFGNVRTKHRTFKKSFGTNSEHSVLRIPHRQFQRAVNSSVRQSGVLQRGNEPNVNSEEGSDAIRSEDSRKIDQYEQSFRTSQAVHSKNLSKNEGSSVRRLGLGTGHSDFQRDGAGNFVVAKELRQAQWKGYLETSKTGNSIHRRISDRLGRISSWKARRRTLGSRGFMQAHQLFRTQSNVAVSNVVAKSSSQPQDKDRIGQYSGSSIHGERWRKRQSNVRLGKTNLGVVSGVQRRHHRNGLDSRQNEHSARFRIQNRGLRRLVSKRMEIQTAGRSMGTSYGGQVRIRHKLSLPQIQFKKVLPRINRGGLFLARLGRGEQLGGATIQQDSENGALNYLRKGKRYLSGTKMGSSTVVASVNGNRQGSQTNGRISQVVSRRFDRRKGAASEQLLEFLGSQSGVQLRSSLDSVISTALKHSRVEATNRSYRKWWLMFEAFLKQVSVDCADVDEEEILDFMAILFEIGLGSQVSVAIGALGAIFKDSGMKDPTDCHLVRQVKKGMERMVAATSVKKQVRLPLPIHAIRFWWDNRPRFVSEFAWRRDGTMVAVGFRLMRRPGELGLLRRSHVREDYRGWMWVTIPKSKTDQLGRGKELPIEPCGSRYCPAALLQDYLKRFPGLPGDFLFPSITDPRVGVSSSAVSTVVKKFAEHAGLEGRYSGHSLRIGGATAAMEGGATMAQLRSYGDWVSDAILRYIRAVGAANAGFSSKMGFT